MTASLVDIRGKVVGDDHCAGLGSLQFVEAIGYNAQSIYIKPGIRFVENGERTKVLTVPS